MSLVELKAIAYDIFSNIQTMQNNLMRVNDEIAIKSQEPLKVEKPKEEKKK